MARWKVIKAAAATVPDGNLAAELLRNIHRDREQLASLLERHREGGDARWGSDDAIYRFWHQSFKAFDIQQRTVEIVDALRQLSPAGLPFHPWFQRIIREGTGRTFTLEDNDRWLEAARPMLEAFWHARFMLTMAVEAAELSNTPGVLPSGWAALLYLWEIR